MSQELNIHLIERNTDIVKLLAKYNVKHTEANGLWALQWPNDKHDLREFTIFDPVKRQFYRDGGQRGFGISKMYALMSGLRVHDQAPAVLVAQRDLWLEDISDKVFKTKKVKKTISLVCPDGTLVEELYNPKDHTASFAIRRPNGEITIASEFEYQGETYVPLVDDLIKDGVVLLPSKVGQLREEVDLLNYIEGYIYAYVDVSSTFRRIAAYYSMFSWLYDKFSALAYLRALGQYGTGKSRFLKTVGSICYRPIVMGGAVSTATIYRMLEKYQGTLLIDEADYPKTSEPWALMVQILNLGYENDGRVIRCDSRTFQPRAYSCYGPKIIAGRQPFDDDALESRCLTCLFYPTQRNDIPLEVPNGLGWEDARNIRNMLLAWRFEKFNQENEVGYVTGELEPRLEQIIRPLQSVLKSEEAKINIDQFVKNYANKLAIERAQSLAGLVLKAIVELLNENKECYYHEIAAKMQPWLDNPEYILSGMKIGIQVRKNLHLIGEKGYANKTRIKLDDETWENITKLCNRYGIDPPVRPKVNF